MSRRDPMGIGYDPDILRSLHASYGQMLAAAEVIRADYKTLPDLLALAAIVDEITAKRDGCARRLERIECQRHTEARRKALWGAVEVSA